ncbi:MAG: MmgE/PrpD family protein [Candidatus Tectomicrobia bacterium]|nr:MmgE/PrpD family protein [Candidatus Tectomicrobia bacterium]
MEFSQQFAVYVDGVCLEQISPQEVGAAKLAILDYLGVALAGVGEGPDQALWGRIGCCPGVEASVIGRPQKTASWLAALMNGTLGHSLDYDDTAGFGHASVIIAPALLAAGERLGCNGRRLLEGYISAYEVGFALNSLTRRGADQHHGMHATGIFGPITSATAAAKVMGLDTDALRRAWGVAVSESAGVTANFGTHTKPLHAGLASQGGVLAAELAASGFTSNPNALDAPLGFMSSVVAPGYYDEIDFSRALEVLGKDHIAITLGFKKYPCGFIAQGAIETALKLREEARLEVANIESVQVRVPVLEHFFQVAPTGDVAGKFSYQFTVASALLDGRVTKWTFSDESFNRPELSPLMERFSVEVDPDSGPLGVLVIQASGKVHSRPVEPAPGHVRNPMSPESLRDKFMLNAEPVLGDARSREVAERVLDLENQDGLAPLMDLLTLRG